MRRDFDLVRLLLLQVAGEPASGLEGYSPDEVLLHKALLLEEGLAAGPPPHYPSTHHASIPDRVFIQRLTPAGWSLLEGARQPVLWREAKQHLIRKGVELTVRRLQQALVWAATSLIGT